MSQHVSKCCGKKKNKGFTKRNRCENTPSLLFSLTQEVLVKAGFMQGGGGPLWGDRCTAAGLFWREQQGHI